MKKLIEYLESIPSGAIEDTEQIAQLLATYWHQLQCDNAEGMEASKTYRMENVFWNPPILVFNIERHGGIVQGGSTRAEIQQWAINVETKSLSGGGTGRYRQIYPMAPRLNIKPIAKEIADLILNKQEDDRLKWNKDGSVRVRIAKIIPDDSGFKQTVEGRIRRFRTELEALLKATGSWHKLSTNVYTPTVIQ